MRDVTDDVLKMPHNIYEIPYLIHHHLIFHVCLNKHGVHNYHVSSCLRMLACDTFQQRSMHSRGKRPGFGSSILMCMCMSEAR